MGNTPLACCNLRPNYRANVQWGTGAGSCPLLIEDWESINTAFIAIKLCKLKWITLKNNKYSKAHPLLSILLLSMLLRLFPYYISMAELFLPSLHSVTVCCRLEIGHGSSIYTVENGKHYNQRLTFFLLESWLLNIWQHTGDTPLPRQRRLFVDDLASRKHSCTGNIENCYNTELQLSHSLRYVIKAQLYTETRTNHEKKQ